MLNTAHIYMHPSGATNEGLIGKAIKQHGRDKFIIGTKLGIRVAADGAYSVDCSPAAVRELTEVSLQRLGTDYIDIFIQNRLDPKVPIEETMHAIKQLVAEGKVKYVGMSEVSAEMLRRAHAVQPITCIEMEWSIWTRSIEDEVLPVARELGIAILAYSPMGRGMLTGKLSKDDLGEKDARRHMPRFAAENFEKNMAGVKKIEAIAQRKGCTTGQLALAWVHAQGEDVFPIPGTKNPKYLDENVVAFHLSKTLTKEDLREIEAAFPPEEVAGTRYGAAQSALLHEHQAKKV
jgi:aryl-alcohol dehydrogenase-like predicted oxidoreductase